MSDGGKGVEAGEDYQKEGARGVDGVIKNERNEEEIEADGAVAGSIEVDGEEGTERGSGDDDGEVSAVVLASKYCAFATQG